MRAKIALGLLILPLATGAQSAKPKAPADQADPVVTRPNPDSSGIYHAGDGVTAPKLLFAVDPEFSDKARRNKLSGTCVVSFIVDASGTPQDVKVKRSVAEGLSAKLWPIAKNLDENAVTAVKQYRFEPATSEGKAVPFDFSAEINFLIY